MSTISFGGLASGLDTEYIIRSLVAIRRQPIDRLESRIDGYNQRKSAYSDMENKLKALQTAVEALDSPTEFASLSATSGDETALTATAGALAQQGTYTVTVDQLAAAQKDRSQGYDASTDSVGTGTFTITVNGEPTDITLTAGASSLADLKFAINEANVGVTATIIFDGSETGGYHLVMTSEEEGTDAAFSVDTSGLSGGTVPTFTNVQPAQTAQLTIDGLTVTSQTNSIADAIEGVTLELTAETATQFQLQVDVDATALKDKVKTFVDAYNEVFTYVETQRADEATLRGDTSVRSAVDRIQRIMTSALPGAEISMLYQAGVKQAEDGFLTFDESEFTEQVADDYSGVRDLFVGSGDHEGTVYLLGLALDDMNDATDGLFKIARDSLDDRVDDAEDRIVHYEDIVASYEERITAQFTAMESLVATLQAQGSALAGFSIF